MVAQVMKQTLQSEPPQLAARFSSAFRDFVRACLQKNPADRPSALALADFEFLSKAQPLTAVAVSGLVKTMAPIVGQLCQQAQQLEARLAKTPVNFSFDSQSSEESASASSVSVRGEAERAGLPLPGRSNDGLFADAAASSSNHSHRRSSSNLIELDDSPLMQPDLIQLDDTASLLTQELGTERQLVTGSAGVVSQSSRFGSEDLIDFNSPEE